MTEFTRALDAVGQVATPAALARAAPGLRTALAGAEPIAERLSAERLEDARLEDQRARAADALANVLAAMRLATDAAGDAGPQAFVAAVDDYRDAVAALRAAAP